jgi:RimJ/RimL family protein N-acetyltransferase
LVQTLPLTVLAGVRAGRYQKRLPGWWRDEATLGAVVHTPPHELVVAALPEPTRRADRRWSARPRLASVRGVRETRSAMLFAAVWAHRTGTPAVLGHYQRLYALDSVRMPPRPNGFLRRVTTEDSPLLLRWLAAFDTEAGTCPIDLSVRVDLLIGEHRALVWTDLGGLPVSLVAWSPSVAGMVRVGPVYTPPEQRRHGFAAAIAAACQQAVDSGARHVVLFTDLANPTSNEIYQRIGFRLVEDRLRVEFTPAEASWVRQGRARADRRPHAAWLIGSRPSRRVAGIDGSRRFPSRPG